MDSPRPSQRARLEAAKYALMGLLAAVGRSWDDEKLLDRAIQLGDGLLDRLGPEDKK